ncbi:hypothetical protein FFLO_06830 [Filobasidium floriforme]|uniref:Uncharacterized protein n=1 Tax=Filobasidium floriforme TaxID=5210 RepID=A0A8K0NQ37_9TREE|nr:uncharacterized protein HD553DRAFT_320638 [Filobasidium floriforme]KAG7527542.1 hypothetical protein FFLO_06830 [Filobasidium floriforme]KAH8077634.1 hypothetical protein HD553DRAFT_320638 [Filobasidium floriforme]
MDEKEVKAGEEVVVMVGVKEVKKDGEEEVKIEEKEKPVELSDSAGDVGSKVDSGIGRRLTLRIDQDPQTATATTASTSTTTTSITTTIGTLDLPNSQVHDHNPPLADAPFSFPPLQPTTSTSISTSRTSLLPPILPELLIDQTPFSSLAGVQLQVLATPTPPRKTSVRPPVLPELRIDGTSLEFGFLGEFSGSRMEGAEEDDG